MLTKSSIGNEDEATHNYYIIRTESVPSLYAGPSWSEGSVFHPGSGTAVTWPCCQAPWWQASCPPWWPCGTWWYARGRGRERDLNTRPPFRQTDNSPKGHALHNRRVARLSYQRERETPSLKRWHWHDPTPSAAAINIKKTNIYLRSAYLTRNRIERVFHSPPPPCRLT